MPENTHSPEEFKLRTLRADDGKKIWQLIKNIPVLDLNSAYYYLILGEYFYETCVVAEIKGEIKGFISAFIPPTKPETLFIWQVAVEATYRRHQLGLRMLKQLLEREACDRIRFLEITVTPSNKAAQALYKKLADTYKAGFKVSPGFAVHQFPGNQHEEELLLRIGPLNKEPVTQE